MQNLFVVYIKSTGLFLVNGEGVNHCGRYDQNKPVNVGFHDYVTIHTNYCNFLAYALENCHKFSRDLYVKVGFTRQNKGVLEVLDLGYSCHVYILDGLIYDWNFNFTVI